MEQAIATGISVVDKGDTLSISINDTLAKGFITAKGNRSVSSAGFRPIVWGGRVWNLSLNLFAVATDSERSAIPAKPEKPKKESDDKADKKSKGEKK